MNTSNNVLMTGGTGFVGSWVEKKKPDGFNVWAMNSDDYENTLIETITGVKYIMHLANVNPGPAIECARRNNARLLYCSSGIIYHSENLTEYRQNKVLWETECLQSGVDVVIARLFTFFGAGLDDQKAITTLFKAAREGRPLQIYGERTYEHPATIRSYMHGREMARWMWAILLHGQNGECYDVGSDKPTSILRLAQRIKALTKTTSQIEFFNGIIPVPYYLPVDTDKTKALLKDVQKDE